MNAARPQPPRSHPDGHRILFGWIVLSLTLILAACGGGPVATPVIRGTDTPTPPPTALPEVATALPAGFPDNPLRLMLIPQDLERATELKPQLENAILQSTSVTVEIVFAENRLELLDALCDTSSDTLTAIWADALTYSVANARRCGDATVWLGRNGNTGETRQIVLSSTLQSRNIQALQRQTFCRISRDDLDTWLLPVLLLEGSNVSVSSFGDVVEYPDSTELLNAVSRGDCAGAGLATSTLQAWQAANPGSVENVVSVLESVPIPYGVLMYPYQIPVAARLALTNELPNLAAVELPTPTPTLTPEGLSIEDVALTATALDHLLLTQAPQAATTEATLEAVLTSEATAAATLDAASTAEIASTAEATLESTAESTAQATGEAASANDEATAEATVAATVEAESTSAATREATAAIEAALTAEPTLSPTEGAPVVVESVQDTQTLLAPFVGPGVLIALGADDLETLDEFLASSGLNFAQLGQ